MHRSELDDIYSLSNSITRKEMIELIPSLKELELSNKQEPMKYIDPYTKKVKSDLVIHRDQCPLCFSKDFRFIFIKHGFDHLICNSCDLIFTLQVLDYKKIQFLEEGDEGDMYGKYKQNSVTNERDQKKFDAVFKILSQHADIKNILDIGSQAGTFLDWAKNQNYSIIGHEFHTPIRNIAISKGHTVLNDEFDQINLDQEFDLITCWDYVDHMLEPHSAVKNLGKHLKKGGLFFFAINNRDCLSAKIMHEASPIFIGAHHTMHFGVNQLKLLMKGYELIHADSYVSELNWISNWLNFKNPELGDEPLMTDLFDPKKICELGLGFKANIVFKKISNT